MIWAEIENKRIKAIPKAIGHCPLCKNKVIPKCGEIRTWHWAHQKSQKCDNWYEPQNQWHLDWKMIFGEEYAEIIIQKDKVKHFADIITPKGITIRLQDSSINKDTIKEIEYFYGERMIWIVNGMNFKDKFKMLGTDYPDFYWNNPRKSWIGVRKPVFIDFGGKYLIWVKEGMGEYHGKVFSVTKKRFIKEIVGESEYYRNFCKKIPKHFQ